MKKRILVILTVVLFAGSAQADSFKNLAGITLGDSMDGYWSLLYPETAVMLRDALYMKEVSMTHEAIPGVRGGSLSYTICSGDELVSRIKIKFEDRSEKLFNELYRLYRERWGKPERWDGNAFKTIQAWGWILGKGTPDEVEVILMHSKVDDLRPGVSIKMTLTNLWAVERSCWEQQQVKDRTSGKSKDASVEAVNLNDFVPH